jgi:hypothetical protein
MQKAMIFTYVVHNSVMGFLIGVGFVFCSERPMRSKYPIPVGDKKRRNV